MTPTAGKMTVDIIQGLLLAFAAVVIVMPAYIRLLRHAGMGKQILEEGPESHQVKRGMEPSCEFFGSIPSTSASTLSLANTWEA